MYNDLEENYQSNKTKRLAFKILSYLLIIIIAFIFAFFLVSTVRFYFFRPIQVDGESMTPTYKNNEVLSANTVGINSINDIKRMQVYIFYLQRNVDNQESLEMPIFSDWNHYVKCMPFFSNMGKSTDVPGWSILIKRAIAVGGDTVEFKSELYEGVQRIFIYVNDEKIDDPINMIDNTSSYFLDGYDRVSARAKITVPENHIFFVGDNRDGSYDSRFFGAIPLERVIGKVN